MAPRVREKAAAVKPTEITRGRGRPVKDPGGSRAVRKAYSLLGVQIEKVGRLAKAWNCESESEVVRELIDRAKE